MPGVAADADQIEQLFIRLQRPDLRVLLAAPFVAADADHIELLLIRLQLV